VWLSSQYLEGVDRSENQKVIGMCYKLSTFRALDRKNNEN